MATTTTTAGPAASPAKVKQRKGALTKSEGRWGLLFAAPAIIGFLVFTLGPMIASAVYSFTDWQIGGAAKFTGLANYKKLFTSDGDFHKSLWVTTYYTLLAVPAGLILSFLAALLLNQNFRGKGFFRTVYYLPTLVPLVANAMLWIWLFNPDFGLLNQMLHSVGLPGSKWITDESSSVPALALMTSWGFGNAAVIFLAGLQGVPRHLYEAVEVDGGGPWSKFRYVTFPMMTPTIFYNLVVGIIGTVQVFVQAAVMTQGGPNNSTLFIVYYLYRSAFDQSQMGYACAIAWVLFLAILVITVILFRTSKRWVYYELGTAR